MELIAGKLNNKWLVTYLESSIDQADWVKAAIAYASGEPKLISFCFENNIRLDYWGRYDCSVPVATNILKKFLDKKSPNFVCRLIPDIFHAKVIWWGGYGVYIGSANLTNKAWYDNIECGVFISESELLTNNLDLELEQFFENLSEHDIPLTQEVYDELVEFKEKQSELKKKLDELLKNLSKKRRVPFKKSIISVDKVKTADRLKIKFLSEWNNTLQILRDLADILYEQDNRPKWLSSNVEKGILVDQFLHAYYYTRVRDGNSHPYKIFYEEHRKNPEEAIQEIIKWWSKLSKAPSSEDKIINDWAPLNRNHLDRKNIRLLTLNQFTEICGHVHAIRDHSLRVNNETYGLPKNTKQKSQEKCIELLANYLWNQETPSGNKVTDIIYHVLYDGNTNDVPNRLWDATHNEKWRIPHFGISALGEIVGWAMPDKFPPRNGRTSKALTALGYNVKVHLG